MIDQLYYIVNNLWIKLLINPVFALISAKTMGLSYFQDLWII